jgi:hypothetical protein
VREREEIETERERKREIERESERERAREEKKREEDKIKPEKSEELEDRKKYRTDRTREYVREREGERERKERQRETGEQWDRRRVRGREWDLFVDPPHHQDHPVFGPASCQRQPTSQLPASAWSAWPSPAIKRGGEDEPSFQSFDFSLLKHSSSSYSIWRLL